MRESEHVCGVGAVVSVFFLVFFFRVCRSAGAAFFLGVRVYVFVAVKETCYRCY